MIDIDKARQDTPGCEHVLHFNNAGSSLMPRVVRDTIVKYLDREMMIGGYETANQYHQQIENVYGSIATLLGAHPDEIALLESASHAWVQAFYAIPFQAEDKILTAKAEYAANYIAYLQMAKNRGVQIEVVPDDEYGQMSVDALKDMIGERVKLISVTHVPTNGGLVNPAKAIGEVAREHGILYLLDACQSVGQMPIDVTDIGCDMLSVTGRKFLRGPRGTGFLYVKRDVISQLEPPTLDLHSAVWTATNEFTMRDDARRFEKWESSLASRVGLGAAVDYALEWGLDAIWERVQSLADMLRKRLSHLDRVTLTDIGKEKCGIVTFRVDGIDCRTIKAELAKQKINVITSTVASTRLDMESRGLDEVVRASVHYYNTRQEIDLFCAVLEEIIAS